MIRPYSNTFGFGFFGVDPRGLGYIYNQLGEDGINLIHSYITPPLLLRYLKSYNKESNHIRALYTVGGTVSSLWLPDELETVVASVCTDFKNELGMFLLPEELRIWKEPERNALKNILAVIEKHTPEKVIHIANYMPGHYNLKNYSDFFSDATDRRIVPILGMYRYLYKKDRSWMVDRIQEAIYYFGSVYVSLELYKEPLVYEDILDDCLTVLRQPIDGILIFSSAYEENNEMAHKAYMDVSRFMKTDNLQDILQKGTKIITNQTPVADNDGFLKNQDAFYGFKYGDYLYFFKNRNSEITVNVSNTHFYTPYNSETVVLPAGSGIVKVRYRI